MNQGESLLQAIFEHPADDAVRLVYADWLEENGDCERAEFIRVQVELARLDDELEACRCDREPRPRLAWCDRCQAAHAAVVDLGRREGELLYGTHPCSFSNWWGWAAGPLHAAYNEATEAVGQGDGEPEEVDWDYCRGFVERVRLPLQAWLDHGPALVAAHPLTRVERSDRYGNASPRGWFCSETWHGSPGDREDGDLPPEIYAHLPRDYMCDDEGWKWYVTEEAARDAFSAACLVWARHTLRATAPG